MNKGATWTQAEDDQLVSAVRESQLKAGKPAHLAYKADWNQIATKVKGRTAAGCQARWNVHLDPTVDRSPWTPELDAKLIALFSDKVHNSWHKRAAVLAEGKTTPDGEPMRRGGGDCCDRYFFLRPKNGARKRVTADTPKENKEKDSKEKVSKEEESLAKPKKMKREPEIDSAIEVKGTSKKRSKK